ncbi:LruC domain-containing protein [Cyclobacterium xiamenense]|uniref:LruC domain-containing protein n=1 Tax=Cyclobacterium xiamenense TaxID=1297121 RepID=UPI0035CE9FBD
MKSNSLFLLFGIAATLVACDPDNEMPTPSAQEGIQALSIPAGFDFSTTKSVAVNFSAVGRDNSPIPNVVYRIFDNNPAEDGKLLQTVRLDETGTARSTIDLPTFLEEVWVTSTFIGVTPVAIVPVTGSQITYSFNASQPQLMPDTYYDSFISNETGSNERMAASNEEFMTLGSWNEKGTPEYLLEPDRIPVGLLKNLNASLPEQKDVRDHNPKLLDNKFKQELYVNEDAEVWVTYVHVGGSYRNAIGYYWYKEGEAPKTASEIKNRTIIFPNVQAGVLKSGDKVKLRGPLDGAFGKGTYIGWFLISNGWQRDELTNGNGVFYADKNLNTENSEEEDREQMVFLHDASQQVLLMGWEDIRRDLRGCDHDFNDVVFYASWNPLTSVDASEYAPVETEEKDGDGDGVSDDQDEYPEDSERAFNNYSPGEGTYGTLLFEDLWPSFGDYDMNDLVVDYTVKEVSDATNRIKEIQFTTVIRATGAGFQNGFGIQLPVASDQVLMVEGNSLSTGEIKNLPSGVEQGQDLATVIITDNVNQKLPFMANVSQDNPHQAEDTIRVRIVFKETVRKGDLGTAPYNPFLIIDQDRDREVHLMNKRPTDLMNKNWLGTGDDDSSTEQDRYFVSKKGFNWALHVPVSIAYTREKVDFTKAYRRFADWANSGGQRHNDWYLPIDEQVNSEALYRK